MYNKREIMTKAHKIRVNTGCTMSEALKQSWRDAFAAEMFADVFAPLPAAKSKPVSEDSSRYDVACHAYGVRNLLSRCQVFSKLYFNMKKRKKHIKYETKPGTEMFPAIIFGGKST